MQFNQYSLQRSIMNSNCIHKLTTELLRSGKLCLVLKTMQII